MKAMMSSVNQIATELPEAHHPAEIDLEPLQGKIFAYAMFSTWQILASRVHG